MLKEVVRSLSKLTFKGKLIYFNEYFFVTICFHVINLKSQMILV